MNIQQKIWKELESKLNELDLQPNEVSIEESLLQQGILDSITFLEFIVHLEEVFKVDFDFSDLDPTQFTSIQSLVQLIEKHQKVN